LLSRRSAVQIFSAMKTKESGLFGIIGTWSTRLEKKLSCRVEKRIFVIRDRQVMLDEDLVDLYGVETKRLVEQVKRSFEVADCDLKHRPGRAPLCPYVFTEQGVAPVYGACLWRWS